MAGGKSRETKLRMRSIQNTEKITKAMGLVASSKLGRAKQRVENSRPYFQILHETLTDIAYSNTEFASPYLQKREGGQTCFIVIGGDRGLAGGYNSNVFKKAQKAMQGKTPQVLPIGKKSLEYYTRQGLPVWSREYAEAADFSVGKCFDVSRDICDAFLNGTFDEVVLVYTNFASMLVQTPAVLTLLPLRYEKAQAKNAPRQLLLYEPSSEEVYDAIVPEYVAGLLYGALCEALASELGARHTAMDSASKNAEEMLETLSLQYNRQRQGAITQEITEIVAGAGEQ